MRSRIFSSLLLLSLSLPAAAQEPELPHLELIQGLREHEHFDLALDYIQKIQKERLPADVAALLPLETARARIGLALQERHGAERDRKIAAAQADLEQFIQANAGHPNLVEAKAELAHLLFQQGRSLVFQAQLRTDRQQTEEAGRLVQAAVPLLNRADQLYTQVMPQLKQRSEAAARNQSLRARSEKRRASEAYIYALWHHAHTLYEIARRPQAEDRTAANALFRANENLTELAKVREQHALGWAALAFSAKCYEGVDDVRSAEGYRRVLAERNLRATLGVELARYYRILGGWEGFRKGSPAGGTLVRTEATDWLKRYPASQRTRHGQHVRFMLAMVQAADYQARKPQERNTPTHKETIDQAVRTLEQLEKGTGDIAWAAEQMMIPVMQLTGGAVGSIDSLRTFKECLLRADSTWTALAQATTKWREAKEEKEKTAFRKEVDQHAADLLAAARRALRLMPRDVKDSDWDLVHQMLITGYLRTGDPYRAALLSDFLAHHAKQSETGLKATVEAMKIYQYLTRQEDPYARDRMLALADRLQKNHPTAPETDEARELLGRELYVQQKFAEAVAVLAQVSPKHPHRPLCLLWAGDASWRLHVSKMRAEKKPLKTPSPQRDQAVKLIEESVTLLGKSPDPADRKQSIYAATALGDIYAALGETDKMLGWLSPLLATMETKQMPPDLDPEAEPRILSLALRGYIEKKDFQRGVLRVFNIIRGKGNQGEGYAKLLRSLGLQLRAQLAELQKAGPAAQGELLALRDGFRQLLQTVEANPQLLAEMRPWLADSYVALGDYRKGMSLYLAQPDRKPPEEIQLLSLCRQAWESCPPGEKPTWLAEWETHLKRIGTQEWAARNPLYIREGLLLKEAQNNISGEGGAVKGWYQFRAVLRPYADAKQPKSTPALRRLYHESQYRFVYCLLREAQAIPTGPDRESLFARIAKEIADTRRAGYGLPEFPEFKPQYEKLLNEQPELKQKVEEAGK